MNDAQLFQQATRLSLAGKHQEAGEIYRGILTIEPENLGAWHNLAITEHKQGNLAVALDSIDQAIRIDPGQAQYYLLKGNVEQDQGRFDQAEASFREALRVDPNFAQAYNQLGIVLRDQKKPEKAIEAFRQAIERDPKYFRAHNNLGAELQAAGQLTEAANCYRRAIELKPDYLFAMHNLATACLALGDHANADTWFRGVLSLKRDYLPSWRAYGRMLLDQFKLDEAEACFQKVIQLAPRDVAAHNLLAETLAQEGKTEESVAVYRLGAALDPANLKSALGMTLTLPFVYRDCAHIDEVRRRFESGLRSLHDKIEAFSRNPEDRILSDILWNNFNLAYQGRDDKVLQKEFSTFVEALLARSAPQYMEPLSGKDYSGRRIRIGFLSSFYYQCTAGKYFSSWVSHLDKSRFETFVYYTNNARDEITESIAAVADHFKTLNKPLLSIAGEVRADDLDILVYPEIGMNGKTTILSAMRLAPVQCAAWGHPVTSGHVHMDYYFSSVLMEPEEAQDHYTERLLLLPGIGTSYPKNVLPSPAKRADFALPEGRTLYLCPQSLFKIHPDNDALFLRIMEADENGVLVFFAARHGATTQTFIDRLGRGFDERGIEKTGRVKILPLLDHDDYLRINMLSDVMLDTLYWSGGNTSLDALSCGLPIVTQPGEFMRGRQSTGMLSAMSLTETVARDEDEFVRIALLLGKNSAYRKEISARILACVSRVLEDEAPIRALEKHFTEIVAVPRVTAST